MKIKTVITEDYILLVDEEAEIQEGDWITDGKYVEKALNAPYFVCHKIIAYYPLSKKAEELDLPLLHNLFEEEINIQELADKIWQNYPESELSHNTFMKGCIAGIEAAQDKQFSLEDIEKAIEMAQEYTWNTLNHMEDGFEFDYNKNQIIQSLSTQQLPKEFIPDYDFTCCKRYVNCKGCDASEEMVNRRLKVTINSEGKEVVQGKWIL